MFNFLKKKDPIISLIQKLKLKQDYHYAGNSQNGQEILKKSTEYPHSSFFGGMGSGKTVANFVCTLFTALSHPDDLIIIIDPYKGATDYTPLFAYKRVLPFVNNSQYINSVIDFVYVEIEKRSLEFKRTNFYSLDKYNKNFKPKLARIHLIIEEAYILDSLLNFDINENDHTTYAYKLKSILTLGKKFGVQVSLVSNGSNSLKINQGLLGLFSEIYAFRPSSEQDAINLGRPNSAYLSFSDRGVAYSSDGKVKFPYISSEQAAKYITNDLSENDNIPYLLSHSFEDLALLKKDPDEICKISPAKAFYIDDLDFWEFIENGTSPLIQKFKND